MLHFLLLNYNNSNCNHNRSNNRKVVVIYSHNENFR